MKMLTAEIMIYNDHVPAYVYYVNCKDSKQVDEKAEQLLDLARQAAEICEQDASKMTMAWGWA